jgi:hypothetical protein
MHEQVFPRPLDVPTSNRCRQGQRLGVNFIFAFCWALSPHLWHAFFGPIPVCEPVSFYYVSCLALESEASEGTALLLATFGTLAPQIL